MESVFWDISLAFSDLFYCHPLNFSNLLVVRNSTEIQTGIKAICFDVEESDICDKSWY